MNKYAEYAYPQSIGECKLLIRLFNHIAWNVRNNIVEKDKSFDDINCYQYPHVSHVASQLMNEISEKHKSSVTSQQKSTNRQRIYSPVL